MLGNVTREESCVVEEMDWGKLVWMVSGAQGNSTVLTVGRCYIEAGRANPRHYHPNSDEVLHVVQGTVRHTCGDEVAVLEAGDSISIEQNTVHNAENIGESPAVCVIVFNTAQREVVGE